jgi:chromate reductase, NAD(P)H dehydrogenase (quinone)
MTTLIGLSGSLRRTSINAGLLRAACEVAPAGATIAARGIAGIPLYDGDEEAARGIPDAVARLKDEIAGSQGLLIASPEYNASIPGVLKNAIDWLSRPADDIARVFGGRPVAIMGASPGGLGTVLAQQAWPPVLKRLGARPWFGGQLTVSQAGRLFDAEGNLTDPDTREKVRRFVAGFVAAIG